VVTILIVDDDESLGDTISVLLEQEGFRAVHVADGGVEKALKHLQAKFRIPTDIVLNGPVSPGHRTNWRISLTRAGSVRMSPCTANQRSNVEARFTSCRRSIELTPSVIGKDLQTPGSSLDFAAGSLLTFVQGDQCLAGSRYY
jgi:CheY-like chemotaxis protein